MVRLASGIGRWIDLGVSPRALGISRIVYHAALFWLVFDLWRWQEVSFAHDRQTAALLLPAALAINAFLVVGLWTRVLLVVNVLVLRLLFSLCLDPYTADEIVANASLLFAFAPAPQALALDSLRKNPAESGRDIPRGFVLLVFTGLALVYADGLRYKLASQIWQQGSAFWLGAALPHFSSGLMPQWAEIGWLMKAATYGALAYEAFFPLILVRPLRAPIAVTGLLVHLGSAVFIALPQFGLIMAGLVALFVPWAALGRPFRARKPTGLSLPGRPPALAAYALSASMVVGQISINLAPGQPRNLPCRLLGLYQRQIFVDWHFLLPAPLMRFVAAGPGGEEVVVPSFDERGYPMVGDRYWKVLGFTMRTDPLWASTVERYVRGWLERTGLKATGIRIYCRDPRLRTLGLDFQADDEERARPWVLCATMSFRSSRGDGKDENRIR